MFIFAASFERAKSYADSGGRLGASAYRNTDFSRPDWRIMDCRVPGLISSLKLCAATSTNRTSPLTTPR